MVGILTNNTAKKRTYEYIINKINNEGTLHFSLIDPDPIKQSPSKAAKMALYAEQAGTDAILIGGSTVFDQRFVDDTIIAIKEKVDIPILRKDFIFDEYQIYESAAFGADALLLIAAILSQEQLSGLLHLSERLGMDCLVEVHDENDLEQALQCQTKIIGINNRDLNTFEVDINTTRRLMSSIPVGTVVVSESGIKSRDDIIIMMECGINAVLIGEALVTADSIPDKIKELMP